MSVLSGSRMTDLVSVKYYQIRDYTARIAGSTEEVLKLKRVELQPLQSFWSNMVAIVVYSEYYERESKTKTSVNGPER